MPKSKLRKGHKKKVQARNTEIKSMQKKFQQEMTLKMEELRKKFQEYRTGIRRCILFCKPAGSTFRTKWRERGRARQFKIPKKICSNGRNSFSSRHKHQRIFKSNFRSPLERCQKRTKK